MTESVPELTPPAPLVSTYTSRPVSIEASQWDGSITRGRDIIDWAAGAEIRWTNETPQRLEITTLEGKMKVSPTDWVIKGTEGEFYPCKDSVFQRKYQREGDAGYGAAPVTNGESSIQLQRHEYAENSFEIHHFTGKLLTSRDDLEELYRQLDHFLYPNPGFEPRIAEAPRG